MTTLFSTVVKALCILTLVVKETDCRSYHVAFLGRNPPVLSNIGSFLYPTINPDPVITSAVTSCTSSFVPVSLASSSFTEVIINAATCEQLVPNGNEKNATGIKVESGSNDFLLHVYQTDSGSSLKKEGYLAIPDEHLGNEYYIVTYCTLGGYCQFAVVGITNNTQVNIIFPDNVTSSLVCVNGVQVPDEAPPGSPVTFMLDEYDVVHFDSDQDLTGTYIFTDNDVGVVTGARDIPTSHTGYTSSNLIEQLPPVMKWGYSFIASPNYFNDAGDIIKIITQSKDTIISISGFSPFKIAKKGEYMELRIDWQMHSHIESSKPVMILQIMSIDLYNETSDVTGTPSMVLVPHVEQWTSSDMPFYCTPSLSNQTLVAVVTNTDNAYSVPILPNPTNFFSSWSVVDGTDFSVQIFEPISSSTTVYGLTHSSYGYCDGSSVLLLNADWNWNKEACVPSVVSPGDNVDNDCDGDVDEDDCIEDDLETIFTSTQQANNGHVIYKSMSLHGAKHFYINITTCDVAMVTLQTTDTLPASVMYIRISPFNIVAELCDGYCLEAEIHSHIVSDCTAPQSYKFYWNIQLSLDAGPLTFALNTASSGTVNYDVLTLSAFAGSVDFEISLPEKDCKKVITADADSLGSNFILPVHDTDAGFIAMLSTRGDLIGKVTVQLDVTHSLNIIELQANQTLQISKSHITQTNYDKITIMATGGEISVYLIRTVAYGSESKSPILPTDILGTSYHVHKHLQTVLPAFCDIYTVDHEAHTNAGTVFVDVNKEIQQEEYDDLGTSHLLKSDRPLAVFCGTFKDTILQIPPVETLGKQFFIPAIDLVTLSAAATIVVTSSEDSTVVEIRGDYDYRDTLDLKGEIVTRILVTDTIFNITSTKPVQVYLQINSSTLSLTSDVYIPPVSQYKTDHVFPGFIDNFVNIHSSFAIDRSGTKVTSLIQSGNTSTNAETVEYNDPTFSLIFVKFLDTSNAMVIPSDVLFNDINTVCTLSTGSPGDGIDNDCDGLIDEEQCSDSTVPGTIDYDIDGSLHEDCAAGTSTTVSALNLTIPDAMVTCPPPNVTGSDVNTGGIVISGTETSGHPVVNTTLEVNETSRPTPTFSPLTIVAADIHIEGASDLPVETCRTECLCPCGWLTHQNYTQEEIDESVAEIQEKLKIKKTELSAVIRTKTSASDDRPSATAVGVVGLVFLIVVIGSVALLDVMTLINDVVGLAKTIKTFITS